jgi:hypothetical protein
MGEAKFEQKPLAKAVGMALSEQAREVHRVTTPRGQFQVRWDEGGSATALGQLAFLQSFWKCRGCSNAGSMVAP